VLVDNRFKEKRNMNQYQLPISKRPTPVGPAFLEEEHFLREASINSIKTGTTYRSALRLFADWLQHGCKDGFSVANPWPLNPDCLTLATVIDFRQWLLNNRSKATTTTYMAAVMEYLIYLEAREMSPPAISLSWLGRQLKRYGRRINPAREVVNYDLARQDIPAIVVYYDSLPLPPTNGSYNQRLTLLRDRAIVNILYSTGARISEVASLDRSTVMEGNSSTPTITGKGNKSRTIFLQPYALEPTGLYLAERVDKSQALFVSHSRNSENARLTITSIHNIVKKAVRALGLEPSLSAHDFRHYRATQLLRAGMPLEAVQELLGHVDINTTRNVYAPLLGVAVMTKWLVAVDESPGEAVGRMKMCKPGGIEISP
jgi:site-specific recombinase XerD